MLNIECPGCHKTLQIPEQYLGQTGKCTHCGAPVKVLVTPEPSPLAQRPTLPVASDDVEPAPSEMVVCSSGLTRAQKFLMEELAKLNGFELESQMSQKVTHLVLDPTKRSKARERAEAQEAYMYTPDAFASVMPNDCLPGVAEQTRRRPATIKQKSYLHNLGVPDALSEHASEGQASAWIASIKNGNPEPPTERQLEYLQDLIDEAGTGASYTVRTKAHCSELISRHVPAEEDLIRDLWKKGASAYDLMTVKSEYDAFQINNRLIGADTAEIPAEVQALAKPRKKSWFSW